MNGRTNWWIHERMQGKEGWNDGYIDATSTHLIISLYPSFHLVTRSLIHSSSHIFLRSSMDSFIRPIIPSFIHAFIDYSTPLLLSDRLLLVCHSHELLPDVRLCLDVAWGSTGLPARHQRLQKNSKYADVPRFCLGYVDQARAHLNLPVARCATNVVLEFT